MKWPLIAVSSIALGGCLAHIDENEASLRAVRNLSRPQVRAAAPAEPGVYAAPVSYASAASAPVPEPRAEPVGHAVLTEETPPEAPQPEETTVLKVFDGFEDSLFATYDDEIIRYTEQWNNEYEDVPGFTPLDPNLVKAMVLQESGGHRKTAYKLDPMQIANMGDWALRVLRDGLEASVPEGGYDELDRVKETPGRWVTVERNGKKKKMWVWDYKEAEGRINANLSIEYGTRWLFQKAFKFGKRTVQDESSPIKSYEVKPGDSLSKIAKRCGTTVDVLVDYNGIEKPDSIRVGQTLTYRPAWREDFIEAMRPWAEALKRYNGGGTKGYDDSIMSLLKSAN